MMAVVDKHANLSSITKINLKRDGMHRAGCFIRGRTQSFCTCYSEEKQILVTRD
jgi:hypothetical protein